MEDLQSVYRQKEPLARFNALNKFLDLQMKPGEESYSQFASRLREKMKIIKALRATTYTIGNFDDEILAAALLRGLPSNQAHLKQVLLMTTTFTFKLIVDALILEEQSTNSTAVDIANRATTSSLPQSKPNHADRPKCTYCKKLGHVEAKCWKKEKDEKKKAEEKLTTTTANSAKELAVEEVVVHFAGNASTHNFTNPNTPLIVNASTDWITDTGATCHMTPHRHWFFSYTPQKTPVKLANDCVVYSAGLGTVRFQTEVEGKPGRLIEFHRVLHVPELRNNLLSVLYLTKMKNFIVTIEKDKMFFTQHKELLFTATVNSSYSGIVDGKVVPNTEFAGLTSTCPLDYTLWHRRFAHLNHSSVRKLIQQELVIGTKLDSKVSPDLICEPCIAGKQTRVDVPKTVNSRRTELLELVHSDVHGPLPVESRTSHYKYWVTFTDDASRFWAVIPLQKKSDTFAAFKQFKAYAENLTNKKIKALRDDKGGEYMSREFEEFLLR